MNLMEMDDEKVMDFVEIATETSLRMRHVAVETLLTRLVDRGSFQLRMYPIESVSS